VPSSFGRLLYKVFEHLLASSEDLHLPASPSKDLLLATHSLGLLTRYKPVLFRVIYDQIQAKVRKDGAGQLTAPELQPTIDWLQVSVLPWLASILEPTLPLSESVGMISDLYRDRFEYYIHSTLCTLR
jgi:hypothetical protein